MIIAFDASANTTSLSEIAPIPLLITFIFMPSMSSFSNEFFTASSLPLTSAFNIIFISFSPASFLLNRSANEACVFGLFFFSFSISCLCSATFLAFFSLSKAINLSPADGLSGNPVIDTGIDGRASTKFSPLSFLRVLTRPDIVPTTIGSPSLKVPFWISKLVTTPLALSNLDSITVPIA